MRKFTFALFVLLCITLSSCKKAKEEKLIGEWKLLPQTAADREDTIIYRFEANHVLYRFIDGVCVDTGDYKVKSEFFEYYVEIRNLNKYDDANYYIEKIKKNILILQCYSPYMRKEFVRNE
ncbi:MAG: hypothetical protein N2449_04200 [Bacteroidales bacterium]|nr:hypothetical protein [Bacteroidales bacterium]